VHAEEKRRDGRDGETFEMDDLPDTSVKGEL